MTKGERFNPYNAITHNALVPLSLLDRFPGLSIHAVTVYGLLRFHAGKNGHCFPSRALLARRLRVKKRRVSVYLAELRAAGLIESGRHKPGGVNSYYFRWHPLLFETGGSKSEPLAADDRRYCSTGHEGADPQDKGELSSTTAIRGSGNEVQLTGSITPAEGGSDCVGERLVLDEESEEEEEDTSWYDYALAQSSVWNCGLDEERLRRTFFHSRFEFCSRLRQAIQHALIAHAGQDATEPMIATLKTWEKSGVAKAWNPKLICSAYRIVGYKDPEQVRAVDDAADTARLMWNYSNAQPRDIWQRKAIASFIEEFGADAMVFLVYMVILLDCCRWSGPRQAEALAPKLKLLWEMIGEFPDQAIVNTVADYLKLEDGTYLDVEDLPLAYTTDRAIDDLPRFPRIPEFIQMAKWHRDQDAQQEEPQGG